MPADVESAWCLVEAGFQSDAGSHLKGPWIVASSTRARTFEAHCRKAGVPRIRVHDTRHTCASLLAALDVHPKTAMRILRHSQISVTMNVYTQIPSPETRKALDRLNQSLDQAND